MQNYTRALILSVMFWPPLSLHFNIIWTLSRKESFSMSFKKPGNFSWRLLVEITRQQDSMPKRVQSELRNKCCHNKLILIQAHYSCTKFLSLMFSHKQMPAQIFHAPSIIEKNRGGSRFLHSMGFFEILQVSTVFHSAIWSLIYFSSIHLLLWSVKFTCECILQCSNTFFLL